MIPLRPNAADDFPPCLVINQHFIAAPEPSVDYETWLAAAREYRSQVRQKLADAGLGFSLYDRAGFAWASRVWSCHFTFLYDRAIYDPELGRYTLEEFLEDGQREYGGYQAIVLWHAYPRIGFDTRNQFDMYRDMPGGLDGLRSLVRQAQQRGVKIFVDYNPWDRGTRREEKSDVELLAELVAAIEADGIFLDTLSAADRQLRERLDHARPGVVLEPELYPADSQLAACSASWAQWLEDPSPPGLLRLKWIEPRHMQHQIRRWDRSHRGEIETAFFNGSGMLIWENVFGVHNPWNSADRRWWRRCVAILNYFPAHFADSSREWKPFYPTMARDLFAHRWSHREVALFTLRNMGEPLEEAALLAVPHAADQVCFDLFRGRELPLLRDGENSRIVGSVESLGCVAVMKRASVDDDFRTLLTDQRRQWQSAQDLFHDDRLAARSVLEAVPVTATNGRSETEPPPGMVLVPGGPFRMRIEHRRRECGCYPDPGTPSHRWHEFLWGSPHNQTLRHDIGPIDVPPFFIDEAEVTNAEFARFVAESGYRPRHAENFLNHWLEGEMPQTLANHPVVYVDLDDARAFARWAGKRLPTEVEWQLAAQGIDGRRWPWGDEFDPRRCHGEGRGTEPVRSYPNGRSPYGCYHMSGNVWEWTESERDDGHTRFVMIRGGSYFRAEGSIWYTDGGAQPCGHHAKFIRMWPGLDRCATIGFRCVVDVQ